MHPPCLRTSPAPGWVAELQVSLLWLHSYTLLENCQGHLVVVGVTPVEVATQDGYVHVTEQGPSVHCQTPDSRSLACDAQ